MVICVLLAQYFGLGNELKFNCVFCVLVQEDGIGLLTIIRGTGMYRHSRRRDFLRNFIPPSMREFNYAMDQVVG